MKTAVLSKKGIALKHFINISFLIIFALAPFGWTFIVFLRNKQTNSNQTFLEYLHSNWKSLVLSLFIFQFAFSFSWFIAFSVLKNQFFQDSVSSKPYPRHFKLFNFLVQEEKTINVTSEQKKQQQTTPTPSTKKDIVSPESPKPIDKEITNLHPTNQQENVLIDKTNQPKNNQELNKDIQNTQFKTSLKDSKLEIKSSDIEVDKSLEKDNSIETPSKSTPEYYSYSITSNPSTKKELSLPSSES